MKLISYLEAALYNYLISVIPTSYVRRRRFTEFTVYAQDHRAAQWWARNSKID